MVPAVSFIMYCIAAFSAVFSSQRYSRPASQVQEAEGWYRSHQSAAACLHCGLVECSPPMRSCLESGTPRTSCPVLQSLTVCSTLETFSAVRLGSGENRGGRNW